jgi:hypothetical protein
VRRAEAPVYGRLRAGVTRAQAQEDMNTIAARLDAEQPAAAPRRGVSVVPLGSDVTGAGQRLVLWMLTGAALCMLLVAVANIAGLSLARRLRRVPDGTSAPHSAQAVCASWQLVAEGVTIALASGASGCCSRWPASTPFEPSARPTSRA